MMKKSCKNIYKVNDKEQSFLNTYFSVVLFNILNLYCVTILNSN